MQENYKNALTQEQDRFQSHLHLLKKQKFIAKAKINVPNEFRHQYEELLAKHHDLFS
jgi:hypothetical protein